MEQTGTAQSTRMQLVMEHLRAEQSHNLDGIISTFGESPTFILNGVTIEGRDAVRGLYAAFGFGGAGAFSNLTVDTQHCHDAGDAIVLEVLVRGVHTGEWQGIPATQRSVAIPMCAVITFDSSGKMAGERVYFDGALLLRQMGVLG